MTTTRTNSENPIGRLRGPVVVIGAGIMGRGIAYTAAVSGAPTRLVDSTDHVLATAMATLKSELAGAANRGDMGQAEADASQTRLRAYTDVLEAAQGATLVIEAVHEQLPIKHEVLRAAERVAAPGAVLATNTSALSVTEIAAGLVDPSRCVGMHFFNPVPRMRLCELVRGMHTSDASLEAAREAAELMGKETVVISDVPGFATSRINALIGNEAMRMLEERVGTAEDIDRAIKIGLNHPMGPLEMGDLVGWDTRLEILEYLQERLGDRFRPTNLQRRMVAGGRHGRKTGQGVFRYADGRRLSHPSDLP